MCDLAGAFVGRIASVSIVNSPPAFANSSRMTPVERRASASLAAIFAARMLGLFIVLPVFALEAANYPGGSNPELIGLAMGIYGLTQAMLQIPFGLASDRLGRKRVIIFGLLVFAAGSFVAATAASLPWLIAGRALQGAGAVSAAVTALLADPLARARTSNRCWRRPSPWPWCAPRLAYDRPATP